MVLEENLRLQNFGFAKLEGASFDYYIQKYTTSFGRSSEGTSEVDVELGNLSNISKKHFIIKYNFEKKRFELTVLGKNGVNIKSIDENNFTLYTIDSPPRPLKSQDLIQIGGRGSSEIQFYFLLPRGTFPSSNNLTSVEGETNKDCQDQDSKDVNKNSSSVRALSAPLPSEQLKNGCSSPQMTSRNQILTDSLSNLSSMSNFA
uniref:FHA domain-containing protein n=1 Tax=Polytomella parva TaxID=51329 RepID=A0A7S0YMJ3_9CHLO|mmetsp:Transcript_28698/g.52727  ORF Transcript_28698/g.52727 Transcript_28698/m.52727 type:complete len:203 (+) Transcript_28698:15-623(+)